MPSFDERSIELVRDKIYQTMENTDFWIDAMHAVSRMVGATGVVFGLPTFDVSKQYAVDATAINFDYETFRDYAEISQSLDPWTAGVLQKYSLKPGTLLVGQQMTTSKELLQSHWYSPVVAAAEMGDVLSAVLEPPAPDLPSFVVTFHRHRPCEPFELEAAARLNLILPDLSRAARFAYLMKRNRKAEDLLSRTLSAVGEAIFVLTRDGEIKFCNASAEFLIRNHKEFSVRAGRLHLSAFIGKSRFAEVVSRVSTTKRGVDFPIAVSGRSALLASLAPLPPGATDVASASQSETIMIVSDPDAKVASAEALRSAFNLTAAEARVARAILLNDSVATIAASQNVSASTVRFHIRSIFMKLDVRRQSELVKVLASFKRPNQSQIP